MPYSLPNYAIDGTWNQHQSIILDVLLDRIFKGFYAKNGKLPSSWRSKEVIENKSNNAGKLINPVTLLYLSRHTIKAFSKYCGWDVEESEREIFEERFQGTGTTFEQYFKKALQQNREYEDFKKIIEETVSKFYEDIKLSFEIVDLFKEYSILHDYRYRLADYLQKIGQTKFRMNYKVKYIEKAPEYNEDTKRNSRGTLIDIYYEMKDFQQIFDVDVMKDRIELNFKTPLGKLIVHNTLLLDTDWVPEEAFRLNKNAYFIYKRFILNKVSGKNKPEKISLWFEDIKSFLDMRWGNDPGVHAAIDKAFKDILEKGLAKGYRWNKDHVQRQYEVMFEWPRKKKEKQQDKGDKLMKLP